MKTNRLFASAGYVLTTFALAGMSVSPAFTAAAAQGSSTGASGTSATQTHAGDQTSITKNETVYVFTDASGSVKNTDVSDWMRNPEALDRIHDASNLDNIEVTEGDAVQSGGASSMAWDAGGKDVYYKGTTQAEAPVKMKVSYKLDGKDVKPADLVGASGKVTIHIDYVNDSYETRMIGGKETRIYTPFVAMTGVILPNDTFTNVEVDNGKIVNDAPW